MSLKGVNETSIQDRLAKDVEDGLISTKAYTLLIEKYRRQEHTCDKAAHRKNKERNKNKTKKAMYTTLCIILALLLTSVAVVYHNDAIKKAYNEGRDKGYSSGYKAGHSLYEKILDEYNFYHKGAVIVTTAGKKYHKYNCQHIDNSKYYIYNSENAKAKGYTACLDCFAKSSFEEIAERYGATGENTKTKSQKNLERINKEFGITGKYIPKIKKE